MTAMGLIVLAICIILFSVPPIVLVSKLLTRPPLPERFIDRENESENELLFGVEDEVKKWRRGQCCWTILGYMLGWTFLIFFICHILVMSIIMDKTTSNLWLKSLLITAIIDYFFLQTSKGFILMCCLSEGFIDFVITFFAGSIL